MVVDVITTQGVYDVWQMLKPHVVEWNYHKSAFILNFSSEMLSRTSSQEAKELARTIKPLVGGSSHHVINNKDFIQSFEGIQLKPEECMMSFDVESLFTSVPIQLSIAIIRKLLEEDKNLHQRNHQDSESELLSS